MKPERKVEKIISRRTQSYMKLYEKLPKEVQEECQKAFESWKRDPSSITIKPLVALSNEAHSAEINRRYRALGFKSKDDEGKVGYVWFWVGSHEDYNKVIANHAVTSQIKKMRAKSEDSSNTPHVLKPTA